MCLVLLNWLDNFKHSKIIVNWIANCIFFLIYKIKWAVLVAYQEEEKQEPLKKFFVVLLMRHQIPECLSFKMASHVAHLIRGFSECHNGLQEALWCYGRVCVCVCVCVCMYWGGDSKADFPSKQLSPSVNWWYALKIVNCYINVLEVFLL